MDDRAEYRRAGLPARVDAHTHIVVRL